MLHAVLKVVGGKQDGKLIPLNTKKFLIGREQDCHLRPSSESVSRHHCAITIDDFTVRVRDLGSSNGTSINGKRIIGVHEANPGDALQIGTLDFEIVFSKAGAPVPAGSPEKGGTSFTLDEFNLEAAEPLSDTTMMVGSDTAVISKKELESQAEKDQALETASNAEPQASTDQTTATDAETPSAEASPAPEPATVEHLAPESAAAEQPTPATPEASPQPAEIPAAAQQQPVDPQMPGYGQQMPGYGQQTPQQPYPYGMPGYGMPQQGMPGYGMPGYPMPGYGMPQQGMPYPGQPMQYPTGQPEMDEYDDDEDDEVEETSSKIKEPPTSLPDPSETGAREVVKSDADSGPKVEAPNPAADILKKYMGGR